MNGTGRPMSVICVDSIQENHNHCMCSERSLHITTSVMFWSMQDSFEEYSKNANCSEIIWIRDNLNWSLQNLREIIIPILIYKVFNRVYLHIFYITVEIHGCSLTWRPLCNSDPAGNKNRPKLFLHFKHSAVAFYVNLKYANLK